MGFGNFLKGVVAQVLPSFIDHGKTYGSYNPPKKKKPNDQNYTAPTQKFTPVQNSPDQQFNQPTQIKTQQPDNFFQGLRDNISLPGAPKPAVQVNQNIDLKPLMSPHPGTVVAPQVPKPNPLPGVTGTRTTQNGLQGTITPNKVTGNPTFVPDAPVAPKPDNFWSSLGKNILGIGANIPEVGLGAARAASGIVQGVTQFPHMLTAAAATGTQKLNQALPNSFTHALNTGIQAANAGVNTATKVVDTPFNLVNRGLDTAAKAYERAVPDAVNGAKIYTREQIPLNILAGLLTLGGSTAAEAGNAGKLGKVTQFLNKPLVSNENNIISKTAQGINNTSTPVVQALNSPFSAAKSAITRFNNTRSIPTADDVKIQQILNGGGGTNRSDNLRVIEQNQNNLSNADRLALAGGDTGQAGLQMPASARDEMLARFRAQAAGANTPTNINTRILPAPVSEGIDTGEMGNVMNGIEDLTRPPTQIQVSQPQPINVNSPVDNGVDIPVRNTTPMGRPIVDVRGDTPGAVRVPTANEVAAKKAADRFSSQAPTRPDQRIEGVTPPNIGNTGVYTKAEIQAERQALDDALANKEINKTAHKTANKELDNLRAANDIPKGKKIEVKQVNPVTVNKITVPTDLPETPGQVRVTTTNEPTNARSAEIATKSPTSIVTPETQAVLDNPKQFNKRQVTAARNQAKLAKAKAKADEATAGAMERSLSAKPSSDKSFVPTGEYTKGRNGNVTQVTRRSSEAAQGMHDTTNLSVGDVLGQVRKEINDNGVISPESTRNLKALRDSGRFSRTSTEFKAINDEYKNAISHHARALSMTDRTARTTSTGDQLANRFVSKMVTFAEDSGKLTDAHIKQVTDAENAFTEARDASNTAGERFKSTGSQSDFEAWKAAQQVAEKADRQAKITEFLVSKDVLKGNKSIEASKAVQEAEKSAGVYSMDSIDANMLSGTGTMVRNFVNTLFPRIENKLFGRVTARAVKPIATVGGSSGRGARVGASIGKDMYKADIAARKEAKVGFVRRTVTAGNTVGERNIQATTYSKAFDHYKQLLKKDGYTGKELNNRTEFNVRTDPDGLVAQYEKDALQANALSSLTHTKKIENVLADGVQKALAGAGFGSKGQQAGRFGAKAITRVGVGFPTVIAKSLAEGFKRATLGIPELGWSTAKFLKTGNKEAYAGELAKAMQHAGSGGGMILLGRELGKMGVISGAYPSDSAERARWESEGRQENSIKIGGQWFNIPGYLGGFALPLMLGATTATGNLKDEASLKNAWDTVLSASPVDSIQSTLDIMTGNGTDAKIKNAATSLARAATPAGSFLAELAKLTDSTKNDTSTKDAFHNILDNIAGGIPGLNNKVNKIAKTDSSGNELHNPNPVATVLGAQGSDQKQGSQDVQDKQKVASDTVTKLQDSGVISNKNLMQLVDKKLAKKISDGQSLTPEEVTKVQKSVTKGVSASEDNNWRENGDYETDKAALSAKLQMLEADPIAKNSEKEAYRTQIKRDDVLQKNNIPYDQLKLYETTSLSDWRAMGNPENDAYDPTTYQKLWDMDQQLAQAGASYKKGDLTAQKYSAKESKAKSTAKGKGSRGGSVSYSADFGKLKAGNFSPSVQQYQTIDTKSGVIPHISVQRPNIVHKIGQSG